MATTLATAAALADVAPTPGALLGRVRQARVVADAAEVEILELAVEWAHAHPDLDKHGVERPWRVGAPALGAVGPYDVSVAESDDPEVVEWCGIPGISWDAAASFAAANAMTTAAGKALIRDALVLEHRLPKVWARVRAGGVQVWRARRIAQSVLGAHGDVVAHLDAELASIASELARSRSLVVEQRPRVRNEPATERVETRRVDQPGGPQRSVVEAAALHWSVLWRRSCGGRLRWSNRVSTRAVTASFLSRSRCSTINDRALASSSAISEQVREWCSRTDTAVTVKPVIDLNDHLATHVEAYEIPDRIRETVTLIHPQCVFPFCTKTSARADLDHTVPWHQGGPTAPVNLAPLCRHHHRLKTHAGWTYRPLDPVTDPGTYLWTDPHDIDYLRTPTGTTCLTSG